MGDHAVLPCASAGGRQLNVQWIAEVKDLPVKRQRAHTRQPSTGPPCAEELLGRARFGRPALPDMNERTVSVDPTENLRVHSNLEQLGRSHQTVVILQQGRPDIHRASMLAAECLGPFLRSDRLQSSDVEDCRGALLK